jgi:hypothetical protein
MKRAKALWLLPAFAALAACYNGSEVVELQTMALDNPDWNLGKTDVGKIETAVDLGDDLIVYGDKGAIVVSGGIVSASDSTVTKWGASAPIPASDGNGTWSVAIDGDGRLLRIRGRSVLEPVSDRYGLSTFKVRDLANAAETGVAFALDGSNQVAFADGKTVQRYALDLRNISATSWRFAGAAADGSVTSVRLDPQKPTHDGMATRIALSEALETAFDGEKLIIEAQHALYGERADGTFDLVLGDSDPFHGIAASPDGVWFGVGSRICLYGSGELHCADAGIGDTATLVGSARGVYAIENGTMRAFERRATGAEALWRASVRPVFARVCSSCHSRGGTSGIDMSAYKSWASRVDVIDTRVLQQKTMPTNQKLSGDDLATISTWVGCQRQPTTCPAP